MACIMENKGPISLTACASNQWSTSPIVFIYSHHFHFYSLMSPKIQTPQRPNIVCWLYCRCHFVTYHQYRWPRSAKPARTLLRPKCWRTLSDALGNPSDPICPVCYLLIVVTLPAQKRKQKTQKEKQNVRMRMEMMDKQMPHQIICWNGVKTATRLLECHAYRPNDGSSIGMRTTKETDGKKI